MLGNILLSVANCSSTCKPSTGSGVIFRDAQEFEAWAWRKFFPEATPETIFEVVASGYRAASIRPVGSEAKPYPAHYTRLMLIRASTSPDHRTMQTPPVQTPEVAAEKPDGLYFVALLDDDKSARRAGSSRKASTQALPHERPVMLTNRAQAVKVAEAMSAKHEKKFGVFGMVAETEPVVVKEVSTKTRSCPV